MVGHMVTERSKRRISNPITLRYGHSKHPATWCPCHSKRGQGYHRRVTQTLLLNPQGYTKQSQSQACTEIPTRSRFWQSQHRTLKESSCWHYSTHSTQRAVPRRGFQHSYTRPWHYLSHEDRQSGWLHWYVDIWTHTHSNTWIHDRILSTLPGSTDEWDRQEYRYDEPTYSV